MALRPILKEPDAFLRQKADLFDVADIPKPETRELLADMIETMYGADGIGLAGPQIGIGKRIIVVHMNNQPHIFFNPEIVSRSLRKVESDEGCLSVPGIFGKVKRHRGVKVKALDQDGKPVRITATELTAIIFQHEIDHLNGTLFIDKMVPGDKAAAL